MGRDTDGVGDSDRMVKIDARVPASVLEAIDEEYQRRGYASRSEAIRDALRDWLNPSAELSDEILEDLAKSRVQRSRGDTVSADEAREMLGLDDGDAEEEVELSPELDISESESPDRTDRQEELWQHLSETQEKVRDQEQE